MNLTRIIARERRIRLEDITMAVCGDVAPSKAFGQGGIFWTVDCHEIEP